MRRMFSAWLFKFNALLRDFKAENPGAQVLASGPAKAIRLRPGGGDAARPGQWAYSLRGALFATPERLEFRLSPRFERLQDVGSGFETFEPFRIAAAEIAAAELAELSGGIGLLLKISHVSGERYQFGLLVDRSWREVPFLWRAGED